MAAKNLQISREEQDEWALRSHKRAIAAIDNGIFAEEIVPVEIPQRKGIPLIVKHDESPRKDTSIEGLARLTSIFSKEGTITAGNAPGVNDGAGALVLMSAERAAKENKKPEAIIIGSCSSGW